MKRKDFFHVYHAKLIEIVIHEHSSVDYLKDLKFLTFSLSSSVNTQFAGTVKPE